MKSASEKTPKKRAREDEGRPSSTVANSPSNAFLTTPSIEFRRNFAHVDGNWPTFVYIPVVTSSNSSIRRLLSACIDHFLCRNKFSEESICREVTPHISLSRTLTLRYHQIDAFVAALGRSLQTITKFNVEVPSKYFFMSNDERTRHFLCIPVLDHGHSLLNLLAGVDDCVTRFQKEVYYSPPVFHLSAASMLIDPRGTVASTTGRMEAGSSPSDCVLVSQSYNSETRGHAPGAEEEEDEEEEEEEEVADSWRRHLPSAKSSSASTELLRALMSVDCVECRIGDRIFRLTLQETPSSIDSKSDSRAVEFREVVT